MLLYQTGFCSVLADKSYKMGLVRKGKQRKKKKKKFSELTKLTFVKNYNVSAVGHTGLGKKRAGK